MTQFQTIPCPWRITPQLGVCSARPTKGLWPLVCPHGTVKPGFCPYAKGASGDKKPVNASPTAGGVSEA